MSGGWGSFPQSYSHSASGPVLPSSDGAKAYGGRQAPPIFPQTGQPQVGPSLAQQRAAQSINRDESWRGRIEPETGPPPKTGASAGGAAIKRFMCEVCHMTKPADNESFAEHLESQNHRHMKVLLQNGIWPASVDGKSSTLKNVHQFEPRVYRMTGNKNQIYCLACQVTCTDATDLLRHQMLPSHSEKVHRLPIGQSTGGMPLIFFCHICDLVMGKADQNGAVLYQNHLRSEQHQVAAASVGKPMAAKETSDSATIPAAKSFATKSVGDLKDSTAAWMTDEILLTHEKMKKIVQRYKEAMDTQRSTRRVNPDVAELKNLAESYKAKVEQLVREAQYNYIRRKCAEAGTLPASEDLSSLKLPTQKPTFNSEKMIQLHPQQAQLVEKLQQPQMQASHPGRDNFQSAEHVLGSQLPPADPKAGDIAKLTAFLKAPGGANSLKLLLGNSSSVQSREKIGQQFTQRLLHQVPPEKTQGSKAVAALAAAGLLESDGVLEFLLKTLSGGNESGMSDTQKKMRVYLLEQLVEKRKLFKTNQQSVTDLMMKLSGQRQPPIVTPQQKTEPEVKYQAPSKTSRPDMPKEQWESMVSHFLKKTEDKTVEELANTLYDEPRIEYVWDGDDPAQKEYVQDRMEYFKQLEAQQLDKQLEAEDLNRRDDSEPSGRDRSSRRERSHSRSRRSRSRSRSRHRDGRKRRNRSRSRSISRDRKSRRRHHDSKDNSRSSRNERNSMDSSWEKSQELSTKFPPSLQNQSKLDSNWSPQQPFGYSAELDFLKQLTQQEQLDMPDKLDDLEQKRLEMHLQSAAVRRQAAIQGKQQDMRKLNQPEVQKEDNWESLLDKLLMEAKFEGDVPDQEMEVVDPVDEWVERPPEFIKEYEEHPEHRWDTDDLLAASQALAEKTESKLSRKKRWDINEEKTAQPRMVAGLPAPKQRIIAPFEIGKMGQRRDSIVQNAISVPATSLASALPPPKPSVSPGLLQSLRGALENVGASQGGSSGLNQFSGQQQQNTIPPLIPGLTSRQQTQQPELGSRKLNIDPGLLASAIQQLTGMKAEITVDEPQPVVSQATPRMPMMLTPRAPPPAFGGPPPNMFVPPPLPPFFMPPTGPRMGPLGSKMGMIRPNQPVIPPKLQSFVAMLLPDAVRSLSQKCVAVSATLEGSLACGMPPGMVVFFQPALEILKKLDISQCCVTVQQGMGGLLQFSVPIAINYNSKLSVDDWPGMKIGTVYPCKPVDLAEMRMKRQLPAPKVDNLLLERIGAVEQSLTGNEWAELYDWINSVPDIFTVPGFKVNDGKPDLSLLAWGFYDHPSLSHLTPTQKLMNILYILSCAPSGIENQWSKKVVHVHVDGDPSGVIRSGIDYRNLANVDEKLKANYVGIFEMCMDKLLASSYFSLLKVASGQLDPRICHMTDPAYCVLGNRILICSSHFDYHKGHLRSLSFLLRDWGLTVIPEDSFFAKRSVSFLGHVFFENTVAPDPEFLNLIDALPYPEKLEDAQLVTNALHHFKHFFSDFSDFKAIKDYKTGGPLKQKPVKFRWIRDMQYAVDRMRKELRHVQPLVNPDYTKPLAIEIVVKGSSGGANIVQKWTDGSVRAIERMSRSFSVSEMQAKDNKNDQEVMLLQWVLSKQRVAKMLSLAKQHSGWPSIVYTRQVSVDWLMNTDHPKNSKYEGIRNFMQKQTNVIFRDRSEFPRDYPQPIIENTIEIESPRARAVVRKEEKKPGRRERGSRKQANRFSERERNGTDTQRSTRHENERSSRTKPRNRKDKKDDKQPPANDDDDVQIIQDDDVQVIQVSSAPGPKSAYGEPSTMKTMEERIEEQLEKLRNPSTILPPVNPEFQSDPFGNARPTMRMSSGRFDVPMDTGDRLKRINPVSGGFGSGSRWN